MGRGIRELIAAVVRERSEKPHRSLYDFCKRMHGTELEPPGGGESLIKCGAFDETGATRRALLQSVEGVLKKAWKPTAAKNLEGQLDLFSQAGGEEEVDDYHIPALPEFELGELLQLEKEVSGALPFGPSAGRLPRAHKDHRRLPPGRPLPGEDAKLLRRQNRERGLRHYQNQIYDHPFQTPRWRLPTWRI